jgi:hypothetical protein
MTKLKLLVALALAMPLTVAAQNSSANSVSGDYVEFRNADVYTGPCFANSETGLTGREAVLGWRIRQGTWENADLNGLSIVAVVRANATLGDPYATPLLAKAVLIVDARASQPQRVAVVKFAKAQAPGLLSNVVAVQAAPIDFGVNEGGRHGYATLRAGDLVRVATRAIESCDHFCHNEEVYYPPLSQHLNHAMPAVALESTYTGDHLGVTWSEAGRRSAFVATFSME